MRIAFTGPESSGKTTFSKWLSEQLSSCRVVNEYAREYLEEQQLTRATEEDFKKIVKQQHSLFNETHTYSHDIFDTDIFVLRIWNDEVFKLTLPELELNATVSMDIHFLCSPDVEWEADPLRSAPDESERQRLFEKYKTELIQSHSNFVILSGEIENKKRLILSSIQNILSKEEKRK
jgi:nicotinamide riboside kinase